ncbi:MAG: PBP1A family penicillin-binding protein [Bacillota bacterium]
MTEKKVPKDQKKTDKAKDKNNPKAQKNYRTTLKTVLLAAAALVLLGGGIGTAVLISYARSAPPLDPEKLQIVETSFLYDSRGEEVTALHEEQNRLALNLAEIPDHVQKAIIAMEDERFYKHFGFDAYGFTRAIFVNLRTRSFSQGASTLTQQLVQNAYLTPEKRIKRKVQEIWLSIRLERLYSKDEILEMYLNRMYFGNGAYGVEAASQVYFNKSARDITVGEAAMLAGMLRWPNGYNPFVSEEDAVLRMKLCLKNMRRLNYISEAEYQDALAADLVYGELPTYEYPHPYFVDYVVHHELIDILTSLPEFETTTEAYNAIYMGGLRIYTTLDTPIQTRVEEVMNKPELYPRTLYLDMTKLRAAIDANNGNLPPDYPNAYIDEENGVPQPQAAMVMADPKTGAIRALGGGREYAKNRNELLRFISLRQPGSAIKPVITYAPAFEEGVLAGAGSVLDDAPLAVPTTSPPWYPENYSGQFQGMVTVRTALSHSLNLPAVRTYMQLGLRKGAEYAQRMGISSFDPNDPNIGPSWTLGGREVTALDMAQAYGIFATEGLKIDLYTVQRIEDRDGNVLYEHTINPEQVLSPQTTFMINSILQEVVRSTTARGLQSPRPMAAKTGTTDDFHDTYLAAYAPNIVTSFWMGYDIRVMGQIVNGWNYSTAQMREIFSEVFKTLPVEQFKPAPSGIVRVEVCAKSGLLPTDQCREAGEVRADYFNAKHVPRTECDVHVVLDICEISGDLAGEFCPPDQIKRQAFFNRPEYITTDGRWKRGAGRAPADAADRAPEETCEVHTTHSGQISGFSAVVKPTEVLLQWSYSGSAIKEFQLFRQLQGGGEASLLTTLGKNKRDFTDSSVEAGKTYIYTLHGILEVEGVVDPATLTVQTTVQQFNVSASVVPVGSGSVVGTGTHAAGSTVTLVAEANGGYKFDRWATANGNLPGEPNDPSLTIVNLQKNWTLTAHFKEDPSGAVNGLPGYLAYLLQFFGSLGTALPLIP